MEECVEAVWGWGYVACLEQVGRCTDRLPSILLVAFFFMLSETHENRFSHRVT